MQFAPGTGYDGHISIFGLQEAFKKVREDAETWELDLYTAFDRLNTMTSYWSLADPGAATLYKSLQQCYRPVLTKLGADADSHPYLDPMDWFHLICADVCDCAEFLTLDAGFENLPYDDLGLSNLNRVIILTGSTTVPLERAETISI